MRSTGASAWFGGVFDDWGDPVLSDGEGGEAIVEKDWFDAYEDKFLTETERVFVTGLGRKRDYPTSQGTEVIATLQTGAELAGRWVAGAEQGVCLFKVNDGGYIWEGNIAGRDELVPTGMNGVYAGMNISEVADQLNTQGVYGSQLLDRDTQSCEIYVSHDGRFSAMVEQGEVTSVMTSYSPPKTKEEIGVGSSREDVLRAYVDKVELLPNPYDGEDIIYRKDEKSGIKFHVNSYGVVDTVTAGGDSIQYVEGCS